MPGCALGPCDQSRRRGGPGCHLCDVVAQLPVPKTSAVTSAAAGLVAEPRPRPKQTNPMWKRRRRVGPTR